MQQTLSNRQKGEATAIERGVAALAKVNLQERCASLRLGPPVGDGSVELYVCGRKIRLVPPDFGAVVASSGEPAKPADRLLAIHYLLAEAPCVPTGQWINFRDFPGGQFYWCPYASRTIAPLVGRIGNDLDLLKKHLDRLEWRPMEMPDLAARIPALGAIDVMLVYRIGDEELEATVDVLFDASAKHILCAEDAAAVASRICLSLL